MSHSGRYSALALLLAALNLWGQADRGTIRGTVTDPAVAAVPQAKVIAVNVATGTQNPTTTTESGNYNITALPAGLYRVEAEGPGFKKLVRENVRVNAGVIVALDLQLELGATAETVTVTAE